MFNQLRKQLGQIRNQFYWALPRMFNKPPAGNQTAQVPKGKQLKIALCTVATGRYLDYAQEMLKSAEPNFFPDQKVTNVILTDSPLPENTKLKVFQIENQGWPYDSLLRFGHYLKFEEQLKEFDYLFAIDADMLFVDTVGEEILSKRVATLHPGFIKQRGTYETSKRSVSRVSPFEGFYYFAGAFYGGERESFFKLIQSCQEAALKDLEKDVIAIWHDESHLNRYLIDNPPTKILSPSYCYPEERTLPYQKKLLARHKPWKC